MAGGTQGQIIDGRFELLERLGSGGMGTVWRARDTALHRDVALKEVRPPDPMLTPEGSEASRVLRERVLREARSLARLSHPHVVTVHHIVDRGPYPWLVMELLPGASLHDRLAAGPLTPHEAARIGRQVLSALRAAHEAGICHRDVKPGNVLLRADGSAVLTDFGIAALQDSTGLTVTGELIGSPEYIAPERIRGTDNDPVSDLWSLGVLMYVCVEGRSPLRRPTTLATLAAVLDQPIPPPVRAGALTPILNGLLVRDPASRLSTDRLDSLLGDVVEGRTPVVPQPTVTSPPLSALPTQTAPSPPGQPPYPATLQVSAPWPQQPTPPPSAPPSSRLPSSGQVAGSGRGRRAWLITGAAVAVGAVIAVSVYALNSPDGKKDETRGGESGTAEATGSSPTPARPSGSRSRTRPSPWPFRPRAIRRSSSGTAAGRSASTRSWPRRSGNGSGRRSGSWQVRSKPCCRRSAPRATTWSWRL